LKLKAQLVERIAATPRMEPNEAASIQLKIRSYENFQIYKEFEAMEESK
jgi:hypothetical protein